MLEKMYHLTVMNLTSARIENNDFFVRCALRGEFLLLISAFLETMLLWHLLHNTKQYHRNLSMIVEQLANQYFVSLIARMFIIYKQLTVTDNAQLLADESFLYALYIRNTLLFVAFYFAPFPVVERCFATYYAKDYEENERRWISYMLSAILYIFSFISAYCFIFEPLRDINYAMMILLNLTAFVLTFAMENANKKRYRSLRVGSDTTYTLTRRVQISENISSVLPFRAMCFSIACFAIICVVILHIDELTSSLSLKNWVCIAFNYSCYFYGTVVPIVMYQYNKSWQREIRRLMGKIHKTPTIGPLPTTTIPDTFGNNCHISEKEHSDVYFKNLNDEWNNDPSQSPHPNPKPNQMVFVMTPRP